MKLGKLLTITHNGGQTEETHVKCDTTDKVDHEGEPSGAVWEYLTEGAKCHHFTQKEGHCKTSLLSRSSRHEEGQA